MLQNYLIASTLATWVAVAALSALVAAEVGWAKLRSHPAIVAILVVALLGVPGAGAGRFLARHGARFLVRFVTHQGPDVALEGACTVFPQNNIWNTPVRDLPVDSNSGAYLQSIGAGQPLHADFSMPYAITDGGPVTAVTGGNSESDLGPYRIPDSAPVESGTDSHVLVLDRANCMLYEFYAASRIGPRHWRVESAAMFDLRSNQLRPEAWTSADAAGLPIFPGLVRYDEVKAGRIPHAVRFTAPRTRRVFTWPARHFASQSNDPNLPPMGQRFRLRKSFDIAYATRDAQVILTALQQYGMMLADNGSPWYITGAADSRWSSQTIADLKKVTGADFEAVDCSSLMIDSDTGESRPSR